MKNFVPPRPLIPWLGRLAIAGILLCLLGGRADAKMFELYADGYLGAMYGPRPFAGVITQEGPAMSAMRGDDFYHDQSGGLFGVRGGIEVLHTDIYLQFDQFITGQGLSGCTLQPMVGWDIDLGDRESRWKGILGIYTGLVFGFAYFPHPPIDNSQIAGIGLPIEGQGGAEYAFSNHLRLQILGTVGYHFMFAGSREVTVDNQGNTQATITHGFHLMIKAGVRFRVGTQ